MFEITHILADRGVYEEDYVRDYSEEGEPMWDSYGVEVELTYCGKEDYEGNISLAEPSEATCQDCIDTCALQLLDKLND